MFEDWNRPEGTARAGLWTLVAGILLVVAGLGFGVVLLLGGGPSSTPQTADESPAATPSAGSAATATGTPTGTSTDAPAAAENAGPRVTSWGGHGRQLAVVVVNDSSRTVRSARVRITARDGRGALIRSSSGQQGSTCCTVAGLPPGGEYGLFLDLPVPVAAVEQVSVTYDTVSFERPVPGSSQGSPSVAVSHPVLTRVPGDAIVHATFTIAGDASGYVVGQAFLGDRRGRLVGVISGRFYCFADGDRRRVRMQLLHPVPPGTRVLRALAYPVPSGADAGLRPAC